MWTKFMPAGNDPSCGTLFGSRCDGVNVIGFKANMAQPYRSDFVVARIDHDFGSKWHFTSSYRYYRLVKGTTNQIDVGGFFPGDKLGTMSSLSVRPQQPWYFVAGLTTNITSNTTNDFHFTYLHNFWSFADPPGVKQFAHLSVILLPVADCSPVALPHHNLTAHC